MRDKNNLSHPETPVFMRVSRDYVRDEGFFYKINFLGITPSDYLAKKE